MITPRINIPSTESSNISTIACGYEILTTATSSREAVRASVMTSVDSRRLSSKINTGIQMMEILGLKISV